MISKVMGGSGFAGVLSYVSEKDGATLLATSGVFVLQTDAKVIASQMRANADQRNLKKPVMHVSLALRPGERASDEQWRAAAEAYLKKMGFDLTKSQFALYRHADRDHDHVHIVVNRVQLDGKVISDSHERRRSHESTRAAEKAAGLTLLVQSEHSNRGRMHELRQKVDRALDGKPDLKSFKKNLESEGIKLIENRSSTTSRLSGISFQDVAGDGKTWKASALGKDYSLGGLEKRGLDTGREPTQTLQQHRSGPAAPRLQDGRSEAASMLMPGHKVDANKLRSDEQLAKAAAADAKAEAKRIAGIKFQQREEEYE
jgi:hypothetical protein